MTAFIVGTGSVSAQNIYLVAGTTNAFFGDGALASSAQPNTPRDLTVDSAGNVYVADSSTNSIRKVTVAGTGTSRFAGDGGPAISAQLSFPTGIAHYNAGVYFASSNSHRIHTTAAPVVPTITAVPLSPWVMLLLAPA